MPRAAARYSSAVQARRPSTTSPSGSPTATASRTSSTQHLGMHVIERTDDVHARRRGRPPRQADALRRRGPARARRAASTSRCASTTSTRRSARCPTGSTRAPGRRRAPTSTSPRGFGSGSSRRETEVDYDLDHVALFSPLPDGDRGAYARSASTGFAPERRAPRVEVGGAFVEFQQGDAGRPRAAAAQPPRACSSTRPTSTSTTPKRARHRGRRRRRRAEHARGLRLGARAREASSTSSTSRRSRSSSRPRRSSPAPAWPASCAAARARELGAEPVVLEKGDRAGRLDAALELRDLAPPRVRALPGRMPRRRSALQRLIVDGSTTRSRGSSRSAPRSSSARPATRARSACASTRAA